MKMKQDLSSVFHCFLCERNSSLVSVAKSTTPIKGKEDHDHLMKPVKEILEDCLTDLLGQDSALCSDDRVCMTCLDMIVELWTLSRKICQLKAKIKSEIGSNKIKAWTVPPDCSFLKAIGDLQDEQWNRIGVSEHQGKELNLLTMCYQNRNQVSISKKVLLPFNERCLRLERYNFDPTFIFFTIE
jgi:transcription elongation factor Elf1